MKFKLICTSMYYVYIMILKIFLWPHTGPQCHSYDFFHGVNVCILLCTYMYIHVHTCTYTCVTKHCIHCTYLNSYIMGGSVGQLMGMAYGQTCALASL